MCWMFFPVINREERVTRFVATREKILLQSKDFVWSVEEWRHFAYMCWSPHIKVRNWRGWGNRMFSFEHMWYFAIIWVWLFCFTSCLIFPRPLTGVMKTLANLVLPSKLWRWFAKTFFFPGEFRLYHWHSGPTSHWVPPEMAPCPHRLTLRHACLVSSVALDCVLQGLWHQVGWPLLAGRASLCGLNGLTWLTKRSQIIIWVCCYIFPSLSYHHDYYHHPYY